MAKITYGKEVLTTQKRYEQNKKICISVEDETKEGESIEDGIARLRRTVDTQIGKEIVDGFLGVDRSTRVAETRKRREYSEVVANQYGLEFEYEQ